MSVAKALPSAAIAIACAIAAVHAHATRQAPKDEVAAATPSGEALGLKAGDRIAGWKVRAIAGDPDSELRIDLEREDVRFAITVTPLGARPENPPAQSQRHAIYYGHAQPSGTQIPDGAIRAITADVTRRLDARP